MRLRETGLLTLAFCCVFSGLAMAEPTPEQWARVMNLSGRQRMLSQKMTKEALLVTAKVDADKFRQELTKTTQLFETCLAGLRDGDESLGLPPTENSRVVKQLDKVREIYSSLKPILEDVAGGGSLSADQIDVLAKGNLPLLKEMNKAVKMYERLAKKGMASDASAAVVINLAGKQRMLTQKMTKECLLLQLEVMADENRLNLRETTSLFSRTLTGLMKGDENLGLPGTKDEKILTQLSKVAEIWTQVQLILQARLVEQRPLNDTELADLSVLNVTLLKEMNKGVKMFEESLQ